MRPAPKVMWPASELPTRSAGKPTALPSACSVVWEYVFQSLRKLGVRAKAIALPGLFFATPQPSSTINTTGVVPFLPFLFFLVIVVAGLTHPQFPASDYIFPSAQSATTIRF